jgi:hypothetical protein
MNGIRQFYAGGSDLHIVVDVRGHALRPLVSDKFEEAAPGLVVRSASATTPRSTCSVLDDIRAPPHRALPLAVDA